MSTNIGDGFVFFSFELLAGECIGEASSSDFDDDVGGKEADDDNDNDDDEFCGNNACYGHDYLPSFLLSFEEK